MSRERARKDSMASASSEGDDDRAGWPLPTAAEAGKAVQAGMSLFDLKIPGVMTVEEMESTLDLGSTPIRVRGRLALAQVSTHISSESRYILTKP